MTPNDTDNTEQTDANTESTGPILVIIRGVPGSGKSFLTAELVKIIGEDRVVALDPDAIDKSSESFQALSRELTAEGVDERFHPYRYSRGLAYEGITSHKIIIWNQPFVDLDGFKKTVERLQAFATEQGIQLPVLLVEVELDEATARDRVTARKAAGGHGPEADVFARFIRDYRSFAGEGYQTVSVSGAQPISDSAAVVVDSLRHIARA